MNCWLQHVRPGNKRLVGVLIDLQHDVNDLLKVNMMKVGFH